MKPMLKYKDFYALLRFCFEDERFHGRVLGLRELITFEGNNVRELQNAFREAVEQYLTTSHFTDYPHTV